MNNVAKQMGSEPMSHSATCAGSSTCTERSSLRAKIVAGFFNPIYCVSVYFVYLLLRQIAIAGDYLGAGQYPLVVWAYLIIMYKLLKNRSFFQAPWLKVLMLLLVSAAITLALNFSFNPGTQIKSAILLTIVILLVYPLGSYLARSPHPYREFAKVVLPAQIITGLQALTSVLMIAVGYTFLDKFAGSIRHLGVQSITYGNSRVFIVFGMNMDSNHAALFGIISVFVTTWAFVYRSKIFATLRGQRIYRVLYWINLALLVLAIPACNSRGARLSFFTATGIAFLWLIVLYYRRNESMRKKAKSLLVVGAVIIGGTGYISANALIDSVVDQEIAYYSKVFALFHSENSQEKGADWKMLNDIDLLGSNKGEAEKSARVYIWEETFDLWKKHPVVGIGPYNTQDYAKAEHLPSENKMLERGFAVHNSYLDVLISYGALGFGVYVVFFVGCLASYAKALKRRHTDWADVLLGTAWIVMMVGVLFLTDSFLGFDYMFGLLMLIMSFLISRPFSEKMKLPVVVVHEAELVPSVKGNQ